MNHTNEVKRRLLIVDDDALSRSIVAGMLHNDFECYFVENGDQAVDFMESNKRPDLVLMDYNMPQMNGVQAFNKLSDCNSFRHVPVVFYTGSADCSTQKQCWKVGAADFISKTASSEELKMRIDHQIAVKRKEMHLENLACKDALTSLYNRQFLKQLVPKLVKQLNRDKEPMSLLMIDVDDFKKYNDSHGHLEGDKVLKLVANVLRNSLKRPLDTIFRFGGEEFVAVLPKIQLTEAKIVAHRMSKAVERLLIRNADSVYGHVTVSIGVATSQAEKPIDIVNLLKKADKAMYKAKCAGKNSVVANIVNPKPEVEHAM